MTEEKTIAIERREITRTKEDVIDFCREHGRVEWAQHAVRFFVLFIIVATMICVDMFVVMEIRFYLHLPFLLCMLLQIYQSIYVVIFRKRALGMTLPKSLVREILDDRIVSTTITESGGEERTEFKFSDFSRISDIGNWYALYMMKTRTLLMIKKSEIDEGSELLRFIDENPRKFYYRARRIRGSAACFLLGVNYSLFIASLAYAVHLAQTSGLYYHDRWIIYAPAVVYMSSIVLGIVMCAKKDIPEGIFSIVISALFLLSVQFFIG